MIDRHILGEKIRQQREAKSISRETVAAALGMSVSRYDRIEQGFTSLRLDNLETLCDLLDVSPAELVREATFPDP